MEILWFKVLSFLVIFTAGLGGEGGTLPLIRA